VATLLRQSLGVAVATMAITAAFWSAAGPSSRIDPRGDYVAYYEPTARALAADGRPILADGSISTRYPPGYPLILAALFRVAAVTGIPETTALWAGALVAAAIASVSLFLAARLLWPYPAALITPLLWVTCPLVLGVTAIEGSEPAFFAVFFTACATGLSAVLHGRVSARLFVAGGLMGAAMLIRPIALATGGLLALAVWFAWRHRQGRAARAAAVALALSGNLVVAGPWIWWVSSQTGRMILLSDGGAPSVRDGLTYATNLKGYRSGVAVPADVEALMRAVQARYQELDSMGAIATVLWEEARTRPGAAVRLLALKAARSWYGTDSQRREGAILAVQAVYGLLIAVSTAYAWSAGGRARGVTVAVWVGTVYFWGMTTMVLSIARYMLPALGLLFLLPPALAAAPRGVRRPWTVGASMSTEAAPVEGHRA